MMNNEINNGLLRLLGVTNNDVTHLTMTLEPLKPPTVSVTRFLRAVDRTFESIQEQFVLMPRSEWHPAWLEVVAERRRQVEAEGYDRTHDAEHGAAQLAAAAGCYALFADSHPNAGEPPPQWPWESDAWKPKTFRRDMVRAAALLLAAIETGDWAEADHA